jgi:lipopolysaccharide export system protein LptA
MKKLLVFFAAFAAGAVLSGALRAAPAAKPITGNHDNNAPINISSDSFQADLNGKTGTWSGNVLVVQGDMKMRANNVHMTTINGKTDKVFASGNVVVDSPSSGTATGDKGVYSVVPRTVVMTGGVVLKKGKNVMRGSQVTLNMATGEMVMPSGTRTPQNPGGRVQSVFMPNSQTQ